MTQTENKRKVAHGPTVHAIKRAKYQAKQERLRQQQVQSTANNDSFGSDEWFHGREDYAVFITVDDVRKIRRSRSAAGKSTLNVVVKEENLSADEKSRLDRIATWIEPFFDLKEAPAHLQNDSDDNASTEMLFIAEGTEPVRLLIQKCNKATVARTPTSVENAKEKYQKSPPVELTSILCKPATFFEQPVCLLDELVKQHCIRDNNNSCTFNIIVGTEEALSEIVGFPVARGALACGIVPRFKQTYQWLKSLLTSGKTNIDATNEQSGTNKQSGPKKILALDAISNTANMGSILRTAAAFGIDAIILSDDSCDAWYRQAVRVSMGHVVTVPTIRVSDLREGLNMKDGDCCDGGLPSVLMWLRDEMKVQSFAAVVDDDSTKDDETLPPLVSLESITTKQTEQSSSWICVLGNEGNGIRKEVVKEVDYRIKISMANDDVDSLSLPVAAGILIHGLSSG
jgi:tRNA G18 (ribose-2'-O)-methylase SpoU